MPPLKKEKKTGIPSMRPLSHAECMELLATVPIGRLGISIGALPLVLPVNFALHDGRVIFRTAPGTKLDGAVAGTVVAFDVTVAVQEPDRLLPLRLGQCHVLDEGVQWPTSEVSTWRSRGGALAKLAATTCAERSSVNGSGSMYCIQ